QVVKPSCSPRSARRRKRKPRMFVGRGKGPCYGRPRLTFTTPRRRVAMRIVTLFVSACWCVGLPAHASAPATLKAEPLVLPGGPSPVGMDYLAYDDSTKTVWVPAGNTGKVDVVDSATRQIRAVDGFPTAQRGTRSVGPSSATVGAGVVYVGNRGDSSVCA